MQKMGWFWVVRGTQGHGQCHHSIERIRLPIQKRNYAVILYRFRDIASYLLKVADDFNLLYLTGIWRPMENFAKMFGNRKLESRYIVWCFSVIPCLAVLVKLRLVTDRQTDRQTRRHSIASRGKKGRQTIINAAPTFRVVIYGNQLCS